MIGKKLKELPEVVGVDSSKCVNCHNCIRVCPVKYCNDGSGEYVTVNPLMCIGCGNCIKKCIHNARYWIDDFDRFIEDCAKGEKIVAVITPSITANFPSLYLNVNGWLKSIGVSAVFDTSVGTELAIKSYMELLNSDPDLTCIISQNCPSVVTYIEMYSPEMMPYLAPVDSPIIHTVKMIKNFYTEYKGFKVAILSSCVAEKRELHETGHGDYSIGFKTLSQYFLKNNIDIKKIAPEKYVNVSTEPVIEFSCPGGLIMAAERIIPGITEISRNVEGNIIYSYLNRLADGIKNESAPLLIDCLNCESGCKDGPLTISRSDFIDDTEVLKRMRLKKDKLLKKIVEKNENIIGKTIADSGKKNLKFWIPGLYKREYTDLSVNNRTIIPSGDELGKIYKIMHKTSDSDFHNCTSCGYSTCEDMAIAIYNGLNRPDRCMFFNSEESRLNNTDVSENEKRLRTILSNTSAGFCLADEEYKLIVVNISFCKSIGLEKDKLIGSTFLKKQFERCSSGNGYSSEIRINRPDGVSGVFLFIANPYYDENKNLVGYFAIVVDISKYKKDTTSTRVNFTGGDKVEEK